MPVTRKTNKKVKISSTNKSKVLYYLDFDTVSIFKDICKKRRISCSEQMNHLIIEFIGKDCLEK